MTRSRFSGFEFKSRGRGPRPGDKRNFLGWPKVTPSGGAPSIAVSGNGVGIVNGDGTPSVTDHTQFTQVIVGSGASTRTYAISNPGSADLTISGLTVPTGFTVVDGIQATIAPGQSDTFTIRLDDAGAGVKSGNVAFTTNVSGSTSWAFAISGEVVALSAPAINVTGNGTTIANNDPTPSVTDHTQFVAAGQGVGGTLRTFTVTNTGNATLTLSSLAVPTGFTIIEGLSASLGPSSSDTFTIRLDDATLGTKSGNITFTTNVTGATSYAFAVSGDVVVAASQRPVASFTLSTVLGDGPLSVTATDTSTNSPTSWRWRFHDGGNGAFERTEQNPTVTLAPGIWSITFWATNSAGTGVEFAVNRIFVRTAGSSYAIADAFNVTGQTPLTLNQVRTTAYGNDVKIIPGGANNVVEWYFGDFYGGAGYNQGQFGPRPVIPGTRTIAAKIIEPGGAEHIVTRPVNVVSQGYTPARTYVPVPTRTWSVPGGETVLTTETRYNESATGGKRPDKFVLRFDPGEVTTGETIVVRDASGSELQSYGMVAVSSHDDGSILSCQIVCWIDIAPAERKTLWILKKTGARSYGTNTMLTSDVSTAIGDDVIIDLLDVRKADTQATSYGDWTINLSTGGLTDTHTVKQHACGMYARFKTSAYAFNASAEQQKTHAYAYYHVYKHPDTGALWVSLEAMVCRAFLGDWIAAYDGPTGIYEIIYKARLRVGPTVIKDWARQFSFPASSVNITTNQIDFTGHGVKADSFWKWVSSSGGAPTGITVGAIYSGHSIGYNGRYEIPTFALRPPNSISRSDAFFNFTDQGSGNHTLEQYIYQAAGKAWKVADTDGRDLQLNQTKPEIVPAWYRDEYAWRATRGLVPPMTVDISDDQSIPLTRYPAEVANYYPGTGAVARGSRDTPGGDDMIGPVHRAFLLWARGPETANGRYWLRIMRVGAAEGCAVASNMVWEQDSGTNGRPRYEHLVMNLGPNKDGNTYPNMGPVRGERQIHHNFFGSNGEKIGDRGIQIYGNIDMSHPDHCTWTDYMLSGSGISLDTTLQLWSRSAIFWAQRDSALQKAGRNHYLPGETYYGVTFINGAYQTRSAGYMAKFLSIGTMLADEIPSRAMVMDILDDNIEVVKRYIGDPTLMSAIHRKYGFCRSGEGSEQVWMMIIICFGALWAIKARGKFTSEPTVVDFFTRLPRLLAGDDVAGEGVLRGPPGYHAACISALWSYKAGTWNEDTASNYWDMAEADMEGATSVSDIFFDVNDSLTTTAGNQLIQRVMGQEASRKYADGDLIKFLRPTFAYPEIPAGFNYRQKYYVYNYDHLTNTFRLSSTPGPGWTPVTPLSTVANVRVANQQSGRSSSRWPAANDYFVGAAANLGGSGEYSTQPHGPLCLAALWGRSDLLPHARHLAKLAYAGTDNLALSSKFELQPNTAIVDTNLRYSMTPEYPALS